MAIKAKYSSSLGFTFAIYKVKELKISEFSNIVLKIT